MLPNAITLSLDLAELENSVVCGLMKPLLRACNSLFDIVERADELVDDVLHDAVERREDERSGIAGGSSLGESRVGVRGGERTVTGGCVLMMVGDALIEGEFGTGPEIDRVEIRREGRIVGFGSGFDRTALAGLAVLTVLVGFDEVDMMAGIEASDEMR
jgi:hypothetical protein